MKRNLLFYLIAFTLLGTVSFLFQNAYKELNYYSDLANRNSTVYRSFQTLSQQIDNAAVINPDLLRTADTSQAGKLFYIDSQKVIDQLAFLKATVRDTANIRIAAQLDQAIRPELTWLFQSNVPDSIVHHKAAGHIAALMHIDLLIRQGMTRTNMILHIHRDAMAAAMQKVKIWMLAFILLSVILLGYTVIRLFWQRDKTETAERQLSDTEQKYRHTMDNMLEGMQIHDREWRYLYVNDALIKYSTYSKKEELLGYTLMEKYPGIEQSELFKTMQQCMEERTARMFETEFAFPNGTKAYFELSIQAIPEGISILSVDRTEQKKAKEKLEKANRLYAFISAINQSIVHIQDEQELLDTACQIAADIGLFKIAWIGMLDGMNRLHIKILRGDEEATKELLKYSGLDYSSPGLAKTATGRAISTGQYAVSNAVKNDPAMEQWQETHARHDIKANISLPLKKFGKVIGVFGLNSSVEHFFDTDEIALLKEAAGDISFALELFDKEKMRKQANENLARSEAKLRDAQAVAHLGSWELDMVNGAVHWSDEMYYLLGFKRGEIEPSNDLFLSMVHPGDSEFVSNNFKETFVTLKEASSNFRMINDDGRVMYIFCEWKFEFDADHKPVRIYGIVQDVSATAKAEEDQALFASIVNSSDDVIISKDLKGMITSWNHGAEKILGYTADEIMGKSVKILIPDHVRGEEKTILAKITNGESVDHYETERVKKDGGIISVSLTISPIRDVQGQIVGASKIMRDISDKKKAEQDIRALNEKLQAANYQLSIIFNTLPANIALLDDSGQIIAVNKGWKQFANDNNLKSANHCLGENYIEVCEKATGQYAEGAVEMALNTSQILQNKLEEFSVEYPCHSPTDQRWFRAEVRPLVGSEQPGAVVMHINITERKLAENEVLEMNNVLETRVHERTSELQEANQALEAFSYSVSHDLRAPVRAMIGFTSIIQQEYAPGFNDDLKEMFEHIRGGSKRMNAIIDDMLTLAKYEKEKLRPSELDMNMLFHSVWDNITFGTPHHATLEMSELPAVYADQSMMQQVVVNLLSNAIKYSSKKENPLVVVSCEQTATTATFTVRDNGAGFDMKHYDRLFGAFQRLHGSSDFEGTGVGLLLVKRILEKHGGTVWAEGKVGEGATFYFSLPLRGI